MQTLHLFRKTDHLLISLLRRLTRDEWSNPTIAGTWTIKDIAAHLLDVTMRDISYYRDHYQSPDVPVINSYRDLVDHLNKLNGDWVKAFRRVSPEQIVESLEQAQEMQFEQLAKLDPGAPAVYSVAWAGESLSTNAFHIARLYTEKFHHQLQIRDALGKTAELMTFELFHPFISTLLKGLPHVYREVDAEKGSSIQVNIHGAIEASWHLLRDDEKWLFNVGPALAPVAVVDLDADTAWKLFTKGMASKRALEHTTINGNRELGLPVLNLVAVMAVA